MRKTLIAAALLATAALVHADTLDRVEVMGSKVRTDVSRTCSSMEESLAESLGPAVARHRIAGSYTVLFDLQDKQVSEVRLPRVPYEYRMPLRSAVRAADCSDPTTAAQAQHFGFIVDVTLEERESPAGGAPRVAMSLRPLS